MTYDAENRLTEEYENRGMRNQRLITIQTLANTAKTGSYDPNTVNSLENGGDMIFTGAEILAGGVLDRLKDIEESLDDVEELIPEKKLESIENIEELISEEDIFGQGVQGEGGAGVKYSPVNPGPLKEDVANTFSGATYTERVLTEDTVMYRVSGGNAKEVGSYVSMTPQNGGLQSQLDLALNPAWGNTTENVTKVVVPKGTTIYEGIAAPQNIYDSLGNVIGTLPGGGNQVYIPKVETGWFQ